MFDEMGNILVPKVDPIQTDRTPVTVRTGYFNNSISNGSGARWLRSCFRGQSTFDRSTRTCLKGVSPVLYSIVALLIAALVMASRNAFSKPAFLIRRPSLMVSMLMAMTTSAAAQEQSGNWTSTGEYTYTNGTTANFTGSGYTDGNFENIAAWTPNLATAQSLQAVYNWGDCRTVVFTDGGVAKIQVDPTIHFDRIGGNTNNTAKTANAAQVTITGSDAYSGSSLTWTKLSGTDDFTVGLTTAVDQSSLDGSGHTTSASGINFSTTAGGSVKINGAVSTFQLCFPATGAGGTGDGIEIILFSNPADP